MSSNSPGTRWIGHPLLGAFAANRQLTVYVRFKMWDTVDKKFEYLPPGIDVSLVDGSPLFSNQTIATVQTDAAGIANFNIVNLTPQFPDMYFVVNTAQITLPFAHHPALPAEWSTKGWRSSNGLEFGYKKQFSGTTFGTNASPIEFDIGVSLFLAVMVESTTETGKFIFLLPNTRLILYAGGLFNPVLTMEEDVDALGVTSFFSFDVKPDSNIRLKLKAENNSTGKGFPFLQNVYVDDWPGIPAGTWSYEIGTELTNLANNDKTSIGSSSTAYSIKLAIANSRKTCAAFTCLKNMTELNSFVRCVALSPDWSDYAGMHINIGFINGGLSWPVGTINLSMSTTTDRSVQIHEFSHQLLWKWVQYSTRGIAAPYCRLDAFVKHNLNHLINPQHALLEGWASIYELLAYSNKVGVIKNSLGAQLTLDSYPWHIKYGSPNPLADGTLVPSSQLKTNWGESVEGVFAAAMFNLFREYVLLPPWTPPASGPLLPPTLNGDLTQVPHLAWLVASGQAASDVRERFRKIFVEPAKALWDVVTPTTTDFIDAVRSLNPSDWNTIRGILQNYFLAFPQIERVEPAMILSAGGLIDLVGRHFFLDPSTKVYVDAELVPSTIESSRKITCLAPARTAGSVVSVMLLSPDGDDILVNGLKYV